MGMRAVPEDSGSQLTADKYQECAQHRGRRTVCRLECDHVRRGRNDGRGIDVRIQVRGGSVDAVLRAQCEVYILMERGGRGAMPARNAQECSQRRQVMSEQERPV